MKEEHRPRKGGNMEPFGPNYASEDIEAWVINHIIAMIYFHLMYIGGYTEGIFGRSLKCELFLSVMANWYNGVAGKCK